MCGQTYQFMHNTASDMLDNCILPDKSVLQLISKYDALETLNTVGKWPRLFSCNESQCPKCGDKLTQLTSKRQRHNSDKKLLITKLHVIEVEIYVKKCKKCYLIRKPDTLQYGLLNVGDVTLISLDIFHSLRNTIR